MNKYELALVVSAKIEDDARTAVVEKAKEYITRAGGTVTEVEEAGKKRLAYEIQHMTEAFYYFIQFDAEGTVPAEISLSLSSFYRNFFLSMHIKSPILPKQKTH